jgi:hypothetical protein
MQFLEFKGEQLKKESSKGLQMKKNQNFDVKVSDRMYDKKNE